jgi:hypothetical protein
VPSPAAITQHYRIVGAFFSLPGALLAALLRVSSVATTVLKAAP